MASFLPYCSVDQLVVLNDVRLVLQHATDTGTDAALADLSSTATAAGKRVLACQKSAQARINRAATTGQRYTREQLYDLSQDAEVSGSMGGDDTRLLDGGELRKLFARIWWAEMVGCRNYPLETYQLLVPWHDWIEEQLHQLELGNSIFDIEGDGPGDAGVMSTEQLGSDIDTRTSIVVRAQPFFGDVGPYGNASNVRETYERFD